MLHRGRPWTSFPPLGADSLFNLREHKAEGRGKGVYTCVLANTQTERNHRSPHPALERHYSIQEIAATWGLSTQTVTKYFADEPGVLKHCNTQTRKRRTYTTLRVPESVVIRVHTRLKL